MIEQRSGIMQILDEALNHTDSTESENTLPASAEGYGAVRFNAMKHGILSHHTVLPHEDGEACRALHAALVAEHRPSGPTEAHLIEELAGIIWRKRRVLQAEGARINDALNSTTRRAEFVIPAAAAFDSRLSGKDTDLQALLAMSPEQVEDHQRDARDDKDTTDDYHQLDARRWQRDGVLTPGPNFRLVLVKA